MNKDTSHIKKSDVPKIGFLKNPKCPSRDIINHVASKWGSLVLIVLLEQKKLRFGEIKKSFGQISDKMLSQTLRDLERDGLLIRKSYQVIPPKVEYSLSDTGKHIAQSVAKFCTQVEKNLHYILISQIDYDRNPAKADWQ